MKTHAQVVIIGGGSLGISLAYHLTKEGWTDIALIEKGELTSGSTWHAAGLVSNFIGNMTVAHIQNYSIELYTKILPEETGEASPFHQTGSLRIGFSELEEQWFRNLESRAHNIGCEFNFVSKSEAEQLNPLMDFSSARVIVSTPNDGHVDPTSVAMPLAALAKKNGAEINRFTQVTAIQQTSSGEWEVTTDKGTIIAEHVVNAAGCFAPQIGAMVGVNVPIVNLEHQYLITEAHDAIKALDFELPVTRDSYSSSYIRQEGQSFLVGPYETFAAKTWALDGIDWSFDRGLFEPDLERIMPFLERQMELTPAFAEVGVKNVINGAITHTPDDNVLAGPQAGLRNFWNLCGSSIGIAQGGIGKYMAQWMVHGQTEINMAPLDSRRFGDWADKDYCVSKAIESYHLMYEAAAPNDNRHHGRNLRHSALYDELASRGALFGANAGFERPLFFKTDTVQGETPTWAHSEAHAVVGDECRNVQDNVGVIDLSATSKYRIHGEHATAFLDQLSSNRLPQNDGQLGLSLFHAPNGGILAEFSITRISATEYYLVGGIASENKDLHWLEQQRDGFDVQIDNLSDAWGTLLVTGPQSRELLTRLTEDDLSNSAFKWLTSQTLNIDGMQIQTIRVSYAGELGYELHMPRYFMNAVYDALWRVGADLGLGNFGAYALNAMRMEKAYRAYGHEFTEEMSALEAGMDRFVDLSREFIGADNLRTRQQDGLNLHLVYLAMDDELSAECFGNEAIFANGECVGIITGGAYGHRVGKSLAFGYVYDPAHAKDGTELRIHTSLGERSARVHADALYDPQNERLRG